MGDTLVAIVETDVLGVKAWNGRCLTCGAESSRYERKGTAVRWAKAHGASHPTRNDGGV